MCEHCSSPNAFYGSFEDIDQYIETLAGWDLEASQLEPGKSRSDSLSLVSSGISFLRFSHEAVGKQLAVAASPGISVFIPERNECSVVLYNQPCSTEVLCCHPQGSEVDIITPRNFQGFTFSASYQLLLSLGLDWLVELLSRERYTFQMTMSEAESFRRLLRGIALLVEDRDLPSAVLNGRICNIYRSQLIPLLAKVVARKIDVSVEPEHRQDHRHVSSMLTHVAENLDDPPTVEALASLQGVSTRYVQQLFKRYVGLSPKQYMRSVRLAVVRRDLKLFQARRGAVTEVASAYGFDHLGQFSRDYKNLFGELPNETLSR